MTFFCHRATEKCCLKRLDSGHLAVAKPCLDVRTPRGETLAAEREGDGWDDNEEFWKRGRGIAFRGAVISLSHCRIDPGAAAVGRSRDPLPTPSPHGGDYNKEFEACVRRKPPAANGF